MGYNNEISSDEFKIIGIIPSRYLSTRFPGKPLVEIDGKSMVQRVYEASKRSARLKMVVVATDDKRIYDHCIEKGLEVCMTGEHNTGTERCAEVLAKFSEFAAAVNIQGDEPFIDPTQIDQVAALLEKGRSIATLVKQINGPDELHSENIPKVVFTKDNKALLFSRNVIPFIRGIKKEEYLNNFAYYKHIGIYGYQAEVLKDIVQLPEGKLEKAESLEQLRWLENGYDIFVAETTVESIAVDTPEDLKRISEWLEKK